MLRQTPSCINWHCWLVGLLFIIMQCDARAVNVSNTWTMPQEGLNVFYRFFRDRISWFEADAVCQFHHANLVTVDNSFQFDATRDLLRELDVNDIVWIGLMRPQSSDRFMWSNSRPLVADTGYWAESLPLMDAPLCAVIDPIRDYRWHALRCGGPETASFLCEMPVPSWADACNLKDMPNLTLQYMADTASIELIRNCQEEGLLRTMCRGKQDRERALQDLICPRERLEAQRINDITNSHFKSLQIINSIPSDNNENNDIELLPMDVNYGPHYPEELQTEKNTVQRLIEQFNVDELMQADEPSNMETVSSFYKIPGLIPKPVKKSTKKVLDYNKKDGVKEKSSGSFADIKQKDKKRLPVEMEEMMMGDQPLQGEPEMPEQFLNEEVSNEILEPLPHIKKTNLHREDSLERMEKESIEKKKNMQKSKELENKQQLLMSRTTAEESTAKAFTDTSSAATEAPSTTTPAASTANAEEVTKATADHSLKPLTHTELDTNWAHLPTTTHPVTIGHPMHPQQPHVNVITEESQHLPHTKEPTGNSHFIPPMLMVKSHYVPPASKHAHNEHDHHQHHHLEQPPNYQEQHLHLEITTGEPVKTTAKYAQTHNSSDKMLMTLTTPKSDSALSKANMEESKLSHNSEHYLQPNLEQQHLDATTEEPPITTTQLLIKEKSTPSHQQKEYEMALTTKMEKENSMKPNTEPQTTPTEQPKTSKNLHLQEAQTTPTATTTQTAESLTERPVEKHELTSAKASDSEESKNYDGSHEKDNDKTLELKSPQTTPHIETDTTPATHLKAATEKSLNSSTQKLYNLETATERAGTEIREIADTTAIETMNATQQQQGKQQHYLQTQTEKPAEIKSNRNTEEYLQTTTSTTEKQAATQTNGETPKTSSSTTAPQAVTQQTPTPSTTAKTETEMVTETLQQIEIEPTNKEKQEADREYEKDKKETIVTTPDILQTATAITKAATGKEQEKQNGEEGQVEEKPSNPPTITKRTTLTATTTVKPMTTTTPQNEMQTTETSSSSVNTSSMSLATTAATTKTTSADINTATTTTTILTAANTKAPASLITASSLPAIIITTTTTATEMEVATASTTARTETSSQIPAAPDTTRNFLKVTTEMPFKPNRRRTLTKPETVSYMKKILG